VEFQEGGRRQALELAEAKKGGAASQSPAMCDSAAKRKTDQVSESDGMREGGSCCCTPGGSMQHAGRQCPHAPRAARGAGVHARCRPLVGACMR